MPKLPRTLLAPFLAIAVVGLVACENGEPPPVTPPPSVSSSPVVTPSATATSSPTPPALPETPLPTAGAPDASCEGGWVTPEAGSAAFEEPLDVIRRAARVKSPLEVVEMRTFAGPESPASEKGYLKEITRWYVKLYAADDLAFQGRFLVERRTFGIGLVAVAPYDTEGFASPDWVGFQTDGSDPQRRAYPNLPGRWAGVPYDFVSGGEGLTIPGLPDAVRGCLAGT